jgi:HK97 family phage major capsid protein
MDEIMKAISQIGANGYVATNIVMNPADWGALQILKNNQGAYILGGPQQVAAQRLWGLPVTLTPQMTQASYLIGQFPATGTIFDRETATVDIAYENEDDFVKNLVCIRAEERMALAITAPQAYVKVVVPPVIGTAAAAATPPPPANHKK